MKKAVVITAAILSVLCNAIEETEHPLITTDYGIVKGIEGISRSGRTYHAFRGIPYAKPPIGNLRFKAPEEPNSWTDILDAQKNAPHCLQKNYLFANPKIEGNEDCLYLNIYTPKLRTRRFIHKGLLPVMVFIHWGGFFAGYSSSDYLGPEYLMDKDVVLVTFNYRLGVLGFYSTNDDASPGNYALKDQVAVLKWIQKNIEYFGGNKKKVILFGQSAGAASVHYHMLSPESKNLFHRAISMSGTALALWAKPYESQLALAKAQAQFVGCHNRKNNEEMMDCLRNVSAEDLVNSGDRFKFFSIDPVTVHLPSIEVKTKKNPKPFITKNPVEYIRNREFHKVPWIVGTVNNEGLIRAEALIRQSKTRNELNNSFNNLMPILLGLPMSVSKENVSQVWYKIKDFYFIGKNTIDVKDAASIQGLINLYTDRSFAYSAYQAALFHNLKGHKDIWFYNFNYTGQHSYGNHFAATEENIDFDWGVSHCDDLIYLFKSPALFQDLNQDNDIIMSNLIIELWTNFAIYGDPTSKYADTAVEKWLKLNRSHINYGKKINYFNFAGNVEDEFSTAPKLKVGIYKNRFKFWEDTPLAENIKELNQSHIDL